MPPIPEHLAELHRHLDGSLRLQTLIELSDRRGVQIPDQPYFTEGMGLARALDCFRLTLSVLQEPDAVRRVADEMCEDAATEGVTTLEIRFAPQLHLAACIGTIVDAALDGVAGRAGLILCGLYGEHPSVLDDLVGIASSRSGVVGIDLAGGPLPEHRHRLEDYGPAFRRAADLGLGRTVHVAEGRDPGEIRVAIERLLAQRIAHATTLLEDPSLVDLVGERGVTIEACPTSNVQTGAIGELSAHPIGAWLDRGLKVCVCADNTLFSRTTARQELERLAACDGLRDGALEMVVGFGHAAAFKR